jgi:GTP-binding protein Era
MTAENFHTGYIAIIGRPNVGKSTLLNHLVGQNVSITSKKAQTTRHRINGILTDEQSQFIFVDTPGFQIQYINRLNSVMNRTVTKSMYGVDVVIFVIEALYFDERDEQVLKLLPVDKPVILAINKVDRISDKSRLLPFLEKLSKVFSFSAMIPVSAERGTQIQELIHAIRPYLPEGPPLFSRDEATDRSERFIAAELIREKLFRLMWDEIPYSTSVAIDRFTNECGIRKIYASIIVDRANQKAMIIGKNGEELKLVASQARRDMEKLFDSKVYLKVWVKVKNGWADDLRVLKTLGYE